MDQLRQEPVTSPMDLQRVTILLHDTFAAPPLKIVVGERGAVRVNRYNVAAIGKETETRTISLSRALCCEFLCMVYI